MKTIRMNSSAAGRCGPLILLACAALLGAALLGACSGFENSDTGTVRVNLGGGARAVAVTDEMKAAMVYDISLTRETEVHAQTLRRGVVSASFTVTPGVWDIAVFAYLNGQDKDEGKPFAAGSGSVMVSAGETSQALITMKQAEEGTKPEPEPIYYTVTLALNGGAYDVISDNTYTINDVFAGSLLGAYIDNTKLRKDGYTFGGWYRDEAYTEPWDFEADTITGNITLYAQWNRDDPVIPDPDPDTITISITLDPFGIEEPQVEYDGGISEIKISRSGRDDKGVRTVTLAHSGEYTNIKWEVPGVGAYSGQSVIKDNGNAFFELDANDIRYNSIDKHILYLGLVWNGKPYLIEIPFEVVE